MLVKTMMMTSGWGLEGMAGVDLEGVVSMALEGMALLPTGVVGR